MGKKKKVKETYEEIAVEKTVKENYADVLNETNEILLDAQELGFAKGRYAKEEPEPNRARTICDADIIIGLLEMDSAVKKIDELNKRIDNIIDAHERCKTLRNL